MKAKYKIGQMVKFASTPNEYSYGTIEAITQRLLGFRYTLEGPVTVDEDDIRCAYQELGKKKKTTRKQSAKRAKMNGIAAEAAHAE